jgi:hypothetical protein
MEQRKRKSGPVKGTKQHSEYEQAAGLILLATNGNDYEATAKQLGIHVDTLYKWQKNSSSKKEALPILLEEAIKKMLEMMPDKWTGNSWAIAFGIMMDKWLLVNGQPTARTETMFSEIDNLSETEKESVLAEAERIIRQANSGGPNSQEAGE